MYLVLLIKSMDRNKSSTETLKIFSYLSKKSLNNNPNEKIDN